MTRAADLSVVMPTYDTEAYVGEAIASVLERADRLLELVVVDDGSQDGTAAIAESFGGPVRVIRQANAGPSRARNVGIAASRGLYVGFLDSDDLWDAGRPDPRLELLDAQPELAGAHGSIRYFATAADGTPQPVLEPMTAAGPPGAIILRRSVLDAVGGFDEAFVMGEDLDLVNRIREAGFDLARLDSPTSLARFRPGSLTRDREAVVSGWMLAARAAIERRRTEAGP